VTDSAPPVGPEPADRLARSDEGDLAESAEREAELGPGPDDELPLDASEADVAEQARSALPGAGREVPRRHLPAEANEADVREQDLVVDMDEEDER
jgi:hypothetical protein